MATPSSPAQPKIAQKLLVRTALGLFVLAGLFAAFRWFQSQHGDFDKGATNTAGLVAALQYKDDGAEAVLIKPDGTVVGTKSWHEGVTDRGITWRPDGRFVFFVSDRQEGTPQVFRWNPDAADADARTIGKRGRSAPTFPVEPTPGGDETMLIVSGGNVLELDPKRKTTPQVLPPVGAEITQSSGDEGGTESQFSAVYGQLGNSFRRAQWCKGKRYIAAIMGRDAGEVLVIQDMEPHEGRIRRPVPVVAGDHVDFAINPVDGSVVYSAQGFQFPDVNSVPKQFIKGNKIVLPFRHVVGIVDPEKGPTPPVVASPDDKNAFGSLAISPDGSTLLVTTGPYDPNEGLTPKALLTLPCRPEGAASGTALVRGEIYEPTWSPDGSTIAFARRGSDGKRDLFTVDKNGGSERNLTGGKGNFGTPLFSPQTK